MYYVISLVVKTQLYVIGVVLISFLLEKITPFKLLVYDFTWKKSHLMATGAANNMAILYFLIGLGVLVYDAYYKGNAPESFRFWHWLVIMLPLTVLVRFAYYHLQARDPKKKGFHLD